MAPVIGIDVSKWDPIVSWDNYSWDFAIVKASQGVVEDPKFKAQWLAARGHVIRSAYSFFDPRVDPVLAAKALIKIMGSDLGEMPIVNDLEIDGGLEASVVAKRALTFCKEISS